MIKLLVQRIYLSLCTFRPWELWRIIPADIRRYAQDDEEERALALVPRARELLKACRLGKGGFDPDVDSSTDQIGSETAENFEASPGEYERQRATAYAEYRAKLATSDPRVRSYREQTLSEKGGLLTSEEATAFLSDNVTRGPLSGLSRHLASTYPWTEEQAEWFVLTGEAPAVSPISGRINRRWGKAHTYGTITLEIEPWVSTEVVQKTYVHAQRKALGRNNRRLGDRSLVLFRFVIGQADSIHEYNLKDRGERQQSNRGDAIGPATNLKGTPSWRAMMAGWNEQFAEKHAWRSNDVRNFERDFRNAETQIANPVRK